jgi:predicted PolB exonuclease-like 3'-5' exonuclease
MITSPVLVFDTETIPDTQGLRKTLKIDDKFSEDDVVNIAKYYYRQQRGTDFFPHQFQKVVAISCVLRHSESLEIWSLGEVESSEEELLKRFFDGLNRYLPTIVSWNGSGFDLPVLNYRSILYGIDTGRYFDQGEQSNDFKYNNYLNRYHTRHLDLMDFLALFGGRSNASLNHIAKLCNFPGKLDMDGGAVYDNFKQGKIDEIRNYCETDVLNTYLVYLRLGLIRNQLTLEEYSREIEMIKNKIDHIQQEHLLEFKKVWESND